ncbi:MAG: hypothetical protein AB3N24_12730 [Leisingera sp.]
MLNGPFRLAAAPPIGDKQGKQRGSRDSIDFLHCRIFQACDQARDLALGLALAGLQAHKLTRKLRNWRGQRCAAKET